MKVADCKECKWCERRRWVQYYEPSNYHPIGYVHAYRFCKYYEKRCADVKACFWRIPDAVQEEFVCDESEECAD